MFRNTGSGQCPHVLAKAEFEGRRRTAGNSVIETYGPANIRTPTELAEGVVPDGGARSATLERMTALSPTRVARGNVSSWAVPGEKPRWTPTLTVSQNSFAVKRYLVVLNNTDFGRS
jgi:hypothetical protein